eukprot:SAG11_NODE_35647_length_265_cov_1.566265_1_plen_56_part_01
MATNFFAHKGTFMSLGARASLAMVKEAMSLPMKQGDRQRSFEQFGAWLGLSFNCNW